MPGEDLSISVGLLGTLLSVAEGAPLWALVKAARQEAFSLPSLVLSLLEGAGETLGSGSSDELRRARKRHQTYLHVASAVMSEIPARVMKGPSIAGRYPAGLVRPVGDLDLVVSDEEALWRTVEIVLRDFRTAEAHVTLFGYPSQHVLVSLTWPAADPVLDPSLKVEVCTAALAGDGGAVGIRPSLPECQALGDLLALAEERFERAFGVKDVVDMLVLDRAELPAVEEIVDTVEAYQVAPELDELLGLTRGYLGTGPLTEVATALAEAASRERRRRETWVRPAVRPGADGLEAAFASGKPVGGLLLRHRDPQPGRGPGRSFVHRFPDMAILRTPVGDYLLSSEPIVERSRYETALAHLSELGEGDA